MTIYVVGYWSEDGRGGCWSAHYSEELAERELERAQETCHEYEFWYTELELT